VWAAAGLLAYGLYELGRRWLGAELAGTPAAAGSQAGGLAVAAVYELTPLKDRLLGQVPQPLGFLLGAWRDGRSGAVQMGARHAAWCVGCCWALMAALFALG